MSETHQYDKADRRSPMKIYFHGFGGLGGVHQQAKKAFCTYKCTACQLAIFMLRELNFRQELSTKGC